MSLALAVCSDVYARGRQREAAVAMSKMSTTLSARKGGSARPASAATCNLGARRGNASRGRVNFVFYFVNKIK